MAYSLNLPGGGPGTAGNRVEKCGPDFLTKELPIHLRDWTVTNKEYKFYDYIEFDVLFYP